MNARMLLVRGGTGVAGTALLAGAMWLYTLRAEVDADELAPIREQGEIGEEVENRDFRITVDRVDVARSLRSASTLSTAPPAETAGLFVIVRVRGMSRTEPLELRSIALETHGGHSYLPNPRIGTSMPPAPQFQPMIWTRAAYLFEIPRERLAGARLVAGTGG
ncbi:hypothetical protein ACFQ07_10100, partial [Actinomadura adrarensis]